MTEEQKEAVQDPTEGENSGPAPQDISMTSAQLKERLERAKAQARAEFADYADLKVAAEKLAALEAEQMGELEKAQKRAADLEAERDKAKRDATETLIRAAFVAAAALAGVAHPEDAYALADKAGVEVAEDGAVVGVAEAVKALVDGGRLVMSKHPAPSLDGGAGSGDPVADKLVALTAEEVAAAHKMGLTPEQYAASKTAIQKRKSTEV